MALKIQDDSFIWLIYIKEYQYGGLYLIQSGAILLVKPTKDFL
jgi:hypothetical protein